MRIEGNGVTRVVSVDGKWLDPLPSQRLWNHSPDGFNWGYEGSGPAQLALAILLAAGASKDVAGRHHQRFKRQYVRVLPNGEDFSVEIDVTAWIAEQERGEEVRQSDR